VRECDRHSNSAGELGTLVKFNIGFCYRAWIFPNFPHMEIVGMEVHGSVDKLKSWRLLGCPSVGKRRGKIG
jgi:hypothetical protein